MRSLHMNAQTAAAIITVKEVVSSTNAANTAFITVKIAFFRAFVIVQGANLTVVLCKVFFANSASLGLRLGCLAP